MAGLWFDIMCDDLDDLPWDEVTPEVEDEVEEPEIWLEDDDLGVVLRAEDSFNDIGFSR